MNIFYGLVGVALGFLLIKYRYQLYKMMGSWSFAESIFGSGGTVTAMTLIGFVIIIFSIMLMFGQLDTVFTSASKYTNG